MSSTSLPFLPRARFLYGTCEVRLRYDAPSENTLAPLVHTNIHDRRNMPMAMEVYAAMKIAGEDILKECIETQAMTSGQAFGVSRGIGWIVTLSSKEGLGNAIPWWNSQERARALVSGRTDAIKWRGLTRWESLSSNFEENLGGETGLRVIQCVALGWFLLSARVEEEIG